MHRLNCIRVLCGMMAWLLYSAACSAQHTEQFVSQTLTVRDALPDNAVECIAQDRQGFMWLGTYRGAARYDGYEMVVPELHSLPAPTASFPGVKAMLPDEQGGMWFATNGNGVYYRSPDGQFYNYLDNRWATAFLKVGNALWVGTTHGLYKLDLSDHQISAPLLENERIQAMILLANGNVLIGTQYGLYQLNPHEATSTRLYDVSVWSLYAEHERIWIGTQRGLALYQPATKQVEEWFLLDRINDIQALKHSHGNTLPLLWLATNQQGLVLFEPHSKKIVSQFKRELNNPHSLGSDRVWKVFYDRSEVLWVATQKGVSKIIAHSFKNLPYPAKEASWPTEPRGVGVLHESRVGDYWIGTDSGGLIRLQPNGQKTLYHSNAAKPFRITHDRVHDVLEDDEGNIWISTYHGLNKIEFRTQRISYYFHDGKDPNSLSDNLLGMLYQDRDKQLWIATDEGGVNIFDPKKGRFRHIKPDPKNPQSLLHKTVISVYQTKNGIVWLGTPAGLSLYDPKTEQFVKHYTPQFNTNHSLSHPKVRAIYQDNAGIVWLGTDGGGLDRLEFIDGQEKFTHYGKEHGLLYPAIMAIEPDDKGRLWLATNAGLVLFDPKTERFRHFNEADGLNISSFSTQSHLRTKQGSILLGGPEGIIEFNPNNVEDSNYYPPLVVTESKILGQPVKLSRIQKLFYQDKMISFTFAALDYRAPKRHQYAYKLEGFDTKWVFAGYNREAIYTNLPQGNYTLRVKATNSEGVWDEKGMSIPISVLPPPWLTWWAYTIYGFALFSALAFYARYHRWQLAQKQRLVEQSQTIAKQERELNHLKDRALAQAGHELRGPISSMVLGIDFILKKYGVHMEEELCEFLQRIKASALRMDEMVRAILDFSKIERGHVSLHMQAVDLTAPIKHMLWQMEVRLASDKKHRTIEIVNHINEHIPAVYADSRWLEHALWSIFDNAMKYTESGSIEIKTQKILRTLGEKTTDYLAIEVLDTGMGMAAEDLETIFEPFARLAKAKNERGVGLGLTITKRLIELLGGAVRVESVLNQGSKFTIELPIYDPVVHGPRSGI